MATNPIPRGPTQALKWGRKILSEVGPWAELGEMLFGAAEIAMRHLKSMSTGIREFAASLKPPSLTEDPPAREGEA